LFLDEVAALGKMGGFAKKLPQMPGYGITALLIYQSSKQLNVTFDKDSGISENFAATIAAATTDEDTAEWLSSMAGNVSEREVVVSRSKPAGALFGGTVTTSEREIYRPLLDSGEVFQLSEHDQYIFRKSHKPIRCKKLKYYEEKVFQDRLLPAPPIGDGNGTYSGLEPIPSPWWGLYVPSDQPLEDDPQSLPDAPEWAGAAAADDLNFDPDSWINQLEMTP
jgi:type IV secretion system protein VirD4